MRANSAKSNEPKITPELVAQHGLMPHPENHVDPAVGPVDGRGFFESIRATLEAA